MYEDEIVIVLPEKIPKRNETPFILTVGPSLTMVIPFILMALISSRIYGANGKNFMLMSVAMGGCACVLGAFWAVSNYTYRKKRYEKDKKSIKDEFEDYLQKMRTHIDDLSNKNKEYLCDKYKSSEELIESFPEEEIRTGSGRSAGLWTRYKLDDDFLFIRMSLGKAVNPLRIKLSDNHKSMVPSEETVKALALIEDYRFLDKVPVGIDLMKEKHLGLIFPKEKEDTYTIILNLIFTLSYHIRSDDVKIALYLNRENGLQKKLLEKIKFLPHFYLPKGRARLTAIDERSTANVSMHLEKAVNDYPKTHFVVFVLDDIFVKEETVFELLTEEERKNVSVVYLDEDGIFPNPVKTRIDKDTYPYFDRMSYEKMDLFSRSVAAHTGMLSDMASSNDMVDFLSLYKKESADGFDILSLWRANDTSESLKVPIGMTDGGDFLYLDVHEKFHGPHGLIAGTTGSGKSELIETYILSLCMSFSPSDVNFFLIDYKGGGTGNHIEDLPHCAGAISNLSGNMILRAMKAIAGENRRRQKLFKECGVSHIDDYTRMYKEGEVSECIPHLILVIDEFAELKKEEPEFMYEIISLAAVGRSLGIHLILATQKPAGVVDDKIWSNSRFRLCLKVQDKADSMDMLKRPEASMLLRPGECYLQIGNNEYFKHFQTAYCKSRYSENDKRKKERLYMINPDGERVVFGHRQNKDAPCLIDVLTEKIIRVTDEEKIPHARCLWNKELDGAIRLEDIYQKLYDHALKTGCFILGMFDDPDELKQGAAFYSPYDMGHLLIVGASGTGKSTFIKTLADQVGWEDDFVLISSFGSDINEVKEYDNCLGLLADKKDEEVFIYGIKKEVRRRKKLKERKEDLNSLYVFIDDFGIFFSGLSEEDKVFLVNLIKQGPAINLYFILTSSSVSEVTGKIFSGIKTALAMGQNDKYAYSDVLRTVGLKTFPKENVPGRFLLKKEERVLECQAAISSGRLVKDGTSLKIKREKITFVPGFIDTEYMKKLARENRERSLVPVGFDLKTGRKVCIDCKICRSFLIGGDENNEKYDLAEYLKMTIMSYFDIEGSEVFDQAEDIFPEYIIPSYRLVVIRNAKKFIEDIYENVSGMDRRGYFEEAARSDEVFIIAVFNSALDNDLVFYDFFKVLSGKGQGIILGGQLIGQRVLDFNDVGYTAASSVLKKGCGYMRLKGKRKSLLVKTILNEREDDEDDYD